jgi:hypothetical protein
MKTPTITEQLQKMAESAELTDELKTVGVHDAARTAFKTLFVYFHGLGLREKIDVTMEQDGFKYQLLFKAVREESNSEVGKEETEKESQEDLWAEIHSKGEYEAGMYTEKGLRDMIEYIRMNFEIRRKNPTV